VAKITEDYLLATEMQLIYNNESGFEPVNDNLRHWKGEVGTVASTSIPIFAEIKIPLDFPNQQPLVLITPRVNHPNMEDDDSLSLRILAQWNQSIHIYQVIRDIKQLFIRVPARPYKTKKRKQRKEGRKTVLPIARIPIAQIKQVSLSPQVDTKKQQDVEKTAIEEDIQEYQKQIEMVSKEIEKERTRLLEKQGVAIQRGKFEVEISQKDVLKSEVYAVQEILENLEEKFEDGDLSAIDFLKLSRKYSRDSYKAEKKLSFIQTSSGSRMDEKMSNKLDLEAELYASILTLDNLALNYENNEIESIPYKKQLRSLIRNIFKTRIKLEKIGFKLEHFIKQEKLDERCPKGISHLRMAEGLETKEAITIPFNSLKKLPSKTADFVSSAIELIDLTRLKSIAKAELLLADIEELIHILNNFPSTPKDYWALEDMKNWKDVISKYKPSEVISDKDCEQLEFQASRWLNDFRRLLKDL